MQYVLNEYIQVTYYLKSGFKTELQPSQNWFYSRRPFSLMLGNGFASALHTDYHSRNQY